MAGRKIKVKSKKVAKPIKNTAKKKTGLRKKPAKSGLQPKVKKDDLLDVSRNWNKYKEDYTKKESYTNKKEVLDEYNYNENIERDKKLMMWAGVCFFMVLILFFWIINIKSVFNIKEVNNVNNKSQFNWQEITDNFNKTMDEIKNIKSEMDNYNEEGATSNNEDMELSQEEMLELRERLLELEKKLDLDD